MQESRYSRVPQRRRCPAARDEGRGGLL